MGKYRCPTTMAHRNAKEAIQRVDRKHRRDFVVLSEELWTPFPFVVKEQDDCAIFDCIVSFKHGSERREDHAEEQRKLQTVGENVLQGSLRSSGFMDYQNQRRTQAHVP